MVAARWLSRFTGTPHQQLQLLLPRLLLLVMMFESPA
jgi:hypothetical protein